MRFQYCPNCGSRLELREIGDEGKVPYCVKCEQPWFDMFPSCIIVLVVNEYDEALLLRQDYMSTQYRTLVSGYMKPGESAEEATRREVAEEVGIQLDGLELIGTYWFGRKDMLMIGFLASARKVEPKLSVEVDDARWIPVEEAIALVHPKAPGSVAYLLLEEYLNRKHAQTKGR